MVFLPNISIVLCRLRSTVPYLRPMMYWSLPLCKCSDSNMAVIRRKISLIRLRLRNCMYVFMYVYGYNPTK